MVKALGLLLLFVPLSISGGARMAAQDDSSRIHVSVVLVQLSVAVTDRKGNYVSGLRPEDFAIMEDNILEKTATFEEGNEAPRRIIENAGSGPGGRGSIPGVDPAGAGLRVAGANIFILFDTSN